MQPVKDEYVEGESARFECIDSKMYLYGSDNLVCKAGGTWSDEPPTCHSESNQRFGGDFYFQSVDPLRYEQVRLVQASSLIKNGKNTSVLFDLSENTCAETEVQRPRFWKILLKRRFKIVGVTMVAQVPQDRKVFYHFGIIGEGTPVLISTTDTTEDSPTSTWSLRIDDGVEALRDTIELIDKREYDDTFGFCEVRIYAVDVDTNIANECENLEGTAELHVKFLLNGKELKEARRPANTTVVYVCSSGYQLNGSPVRVCEENGLWRGEPPTCNFTGVTQIVSEYTNCGNASWYYEMDLWIGIAIGSGVTLALCGLTIVVFAIITKKRHRSAPKRSINKQESSTTSTTESSVGGSSSSGMGYHLPYSTKLEVGELYQDVIDYEDAESGQSSAIYYDINEEYASGSGRSRGQGRAPRGLVSRQPRWPIPMANTTVVRSASVDEQKANPRTYLEIIG